MPTHFKLLRTIEFHETDAAGFVHFSQYFKFMEEAEHAFLRSLGVSVFEKGQGGDSWIGWPRIHAACQYKSHRGGNGRIDLTLRQTKPDNR